MDKTISSMIERINDGGFGFRIEKAGKGWETLHVAIDKSNGMATPISKRDIVTKYTQLFGSKRLKKGGGYVELSNS